MAQWRYKITRPYIKRSIYLEGVSFSNEWMTIEDGKLMIKPGYSWDGCSPSFRIPGTQWWIGTPDGTLNPDGRPQTFYATLVHDALCQFRPNIPIDKASTVALFYDMLLEGGFKTWRAELYATAVNLLGPQKWLGKARLDTDMPEPSSV